MVNIRAPRDRGGSPSQQEIFLDLECHDETSATNVVFLRPGVVGTNPTDPVLGPPGCVSRGSVGGDPSACHNLGGGEKCRRYTQCLVVLVPSRTEPQTVHLGQPREHRLDRGRGDLHLDYGAPGIGGGQCTLVDHTGFWGPPVLVRMVRSTNPESLLEGPGVPSPVRIETRPPRNAFNPDVGPNVGPMGPRRQNPSWTNDVPLVSGNRKSPRRGRKHDPEENSRKTL